MKETAVTLNIGGMTCEGCQAAVEERLRKTRGVIKADVSYVTGTARVTFDIHAVSRDAVIAAVKKSGYKVLSDTARPGGAGRVAAVAAAVAALYALSEYFGLLGFLAPSRLAQSGMGFGMVFAVGLLTSAHCVAMCGGINLSQCLPQGAASRGKPRAAALKPTLLYNAGRILCYTALGFAAGALGAVFSLSALAQGALKLTAGLFMLIMGVNMLGLFPALRRLTPRMPRFFARLAGKGAARRGGPLIVGLLNGFMPCGPLQAMQLYALSASSAAAGAFSMFLFGAGTLPLMFGLGALGAAAGKKFMSRAVTVGAVLVLTLGLSMLTQGINLGFGGFSAPGADTATPDADGGITLENGAQLVVGTLSPRAYPAITVREGVPVRWTIDAPRGSINGCNNRMFIREYGVEHTFSYGENLIEFTPDRAGTYIYTCWMGMIRGSITVLAAE
ncbi:MAG: sulfite exporter TauE/SafE family protein [Oscillospiraceae bacterium]|jgi:sulfite exporter TauE/SafE/copper chaperone CopZ|nr:sulfite exporter TauE/SafE family protein [Oscillospiraceae bacterium]